jgi:hypothetical protein
MDFRHQREVPQSAENKPPHQADADGRLLLYSIATVRAEAFNQTLPSQNQYTIGERMIKKITMLVNDFITSGEITGNAENGLMARRITLLLPRWIPPMLLLTPSTYLAPTMFF